MKPLRGFIWSSLRWPGGWPSPWVIGGVMLPSFVIAACAASVTAPAPREHGPRDVAVSVPPVPAATLPTPPARDRVPVPDPPPASGALAPPNDASRSTVRFRDPPRVRVALKSLGDHTRIVVEHGWTIRGGDGSLFARGVGLSELLERGDTRLGRYEFSGKQAELVPSSPGDLLIGGRRYPGTLRMGWFQTNNMFLGIPEVVVDVETYLEGVVAGELPPEFTREARRAQAILARTYLLSQPTASWTAETIAVDDTGLTDQEFVGIAGTPAQQAAVRDAVASTRGEVLFDGVNPLRAWYHSICGGRTTSSAPVFRVPATGPLSGVACTTCVGTKYYRWTATLPGAKVVAAAKLTGALKGFRVVDTSPDGRAKTIEVKAASGTAKVAAPDFRLAVGPKDLRSTWLDRADVVKGDLVVAGRGWGHGVGMCQWGANGMAKQGSTAEAIVAHYYPGAEIRRLW